MSRTPGFRFRTLRPILALGLGALYPLTGRADAVELSVPELVDRLRHITPWPKRPEYPAEAWQYLIETARLFQTLPPGKVTAVLHEYEKEWIPAQRWEAIIRPIRTGMLENWDHGPTSYEQIDAAYRRYCALRMPGVKGQPLSSPVAGQGFASTAEASKAFLLLRAMFELPSTGDPDADPVGDRQFTTSPRFYGHGGNLSWPVVWTPESPRLVAPLFLFRGAPYKAVAEYVQFLGGYPFRKLDAKADENPGRTAPRVPKAKIDALMAIVGRIGINRDGADRWGALNHYDSPDIAPKLQEFLDQGGIPVDVQDETGETALYYSLATGRIGCARLLLERGADPKIEDFRGRSAIFAATGRETTINVLPATGVDFDVADYSGKTPLMQAAQSRNLPVVKLLLARGCDPNRQDELGRTALMFAADDLGEYQLEMVPGIIEALLAAGAKPGLTTIFGETIFTVMEKADRPVKTVLRKALMNVKP